MADCFTHFSCLIDVGTADKAARALVLFQELRATDQDADDPEVSGFTLARQGAPEGSTLWIHDNEHGDVEAVIRFVMRLAEDLDLTGTDRLHGAPPAVFRRQRPRASPTRSTE